MWGWVKKLGKIGLAAAPYIAAPFTGGASLAFAPMANKALGAWNQHDAENAYEKGLGPSSFDKYLGMGANVAGMANGFGAFNKLGGASNTGGLGPSRPPMQGGNIQDRFGGYGGYGGTPGFVAEQGGGGGWSRNIMDMIGGMADRYGGGGNGGGIRQPNYSGGQQQQQDYGSIGPRAMPRSNGVMPMGGYGYNDNPMNQMDQRNPNLAQSIFQGRQEALMNQPWRNPNFDRSQGMNIYPQMGY